MMWVNTYSRSAGFPQINAAAVGSVWSWRPIHGLNSGRGMKESSEVVAAHPELGGVYGPPVWQHRCMKLDGDVAVPLNTSSRVLVYGAEKRPPAEPLHLC